MALLGVDLVERGVGLLVERDVVEDVELRLGPEVGDVRDAAGAQMLLRLDRHVARVARVRLARDRVEHRAHQRDRRRLVERIQDRRGRIGQQQHVGLVDLLEAADRRAVEPDPVGERLLVQARKRHPHVLPRPRQVGELQIDHVRAVALGEREHIAGSTARSPASARTLSGSVTFPLTRSAIVIPSSSSRRSKRILPPSALAS